MGGERGRGKKFGKKRTGVRVREVIKGQEEEREEAERLEEAVRWLERR